MTKQDLFDQAVQIAWNMDCAAGNGGYYSAAFDDIEAWNAKIADESVSVADFEKLIKDILG